MSKKIKSVQLTFTSMAKADVHFGIKSYFFHLTQGFLPNENTPTLGWGPALGATGEIEISKDTSLKDHQLGFIQICKINAQERYYAGRTRKDGSTAIRPAQLITRNYLDFENDNPFTGKALFEFPNKKATVKFSDHPGERGSLVWDNSITKGKNLLFHAISKSDFWTILSLRDPSGNYEHLAYFEWWANWEVRINRWEKDKPVSYTRNCSSPQTSELIIGPPPAAIFAGLALDGSDVSMNWKLDDIERMAVSKNPPSFLVAENSDWFSTVPRDFYKP